VYFGIVGSDFTSFTSFAEQQRYRPKYGMTDDAHVATTGGTYSPQPDNFDGTVNILGARYGENNTPGMKPDAGTARCDALYTAKGMPPTWKQKVGYGGIVCGFLWTLDGLLDNASSLEGEVLVRTFGALGKFESSFPFGPLDFGRATAERPWADGNWRTAKWLKSCTCWRIVEPTFRPFPQR
jgi:hypothetical protein